MENKLSNIERVPFIHLLSSPNGKYFFDVNRNEIVAINDKVYQALKSILNNEFDKISHDVEDEINRIKVMGYLSDHKVKEIEHPYHKHLEANLERKLKRVCLQVTQNCNLRCAYCIYSDVNNSKQRSHTAKNMSFETAKQAVDFLLEHSVESDSVNVGFYGGEPLLAFNLIKDIVIYAKEIFEGKDLSFNITSNCTLLRDDIIEFFVKHDIHLMVSIDGPAEIHDESRRFVADGSGSFAVILEKLKSISTKYPDYVSKMSVSMVMNPQNDYECINSIFVKYDIFKNIKNINAVTIDDAYSIEKTTFTDDFIEKQKYLTFLAFLGYFGRLEDVYISKIANQEILSLVNKINRMNRRFELPKTTSPGGPCLPGGARLFVDIDGNFYPCERVSETSDIMRIGSLSDGFDYNKVTALLNVASTTSEVCRNCWAFSNCTLCAKQSDDNGTLSKELRLSHCNSVREAVHDDLLNMIMLQEYSQIYSYGS
ncbi:MAG: bacteriocin maturation radical enzyme [Herbinix sp.]|nr:bacteriocin maturation radical enzyme [Herbinix sp.]